MIRADRRTDHALGKTLGVPLFQEQAMQVAIVCAGFTPSEADQLRRSMATFEFTGGVPHFKDQLIGGMVERFLGIAPVWAISRKRSRLRACIALRAKWRRSACVWPQRSWSMCKTSSDDAFC
jgi:hypothetical protein